MAKVNNKEQLDKVSGNESPFMEIKEGETRIRIIGDVHAIKEHSILVGGKNRFPACPTENARMNGSQDIEPCPLCELGYPVKTSFVAFAVEREQEQFNSKTGVKETVGGRASVLKKGSTVFSPIMTFMDDADFGHSEDYDFKIKAEGKGLSRKYTIMAISADKCSPLSDLEKANLENLKGKVSLEKMETPLKYQEIVEIIGSNFPQYKAPAKKEKDILDF